MSVDWTKSMNQTFEYYVVDPITWKEVSQLRNVRSSTISRDATVDTLGSANIDLDENIGECYIRVYLITNQNGFTDRFPLGTFLIQTPSSKYDGKVTTYSVDAYTPLLELKESQPPYGYSSLKGDNIMEKASILAREQTRAPVVLSTSDKKLTDDFVANTNDTWITYINDLIAGAKFTIGLDEMSRVIFEPVQELAALQPVWTYTDDNSSILYSDITVDKDLYGIPNVVEVISSNSGGFLYSKVVNDDPNSPTSTVSRGREILRRVDDPKLPGITRQDQLDLYAENLLKQVSVLEYTISYMHGYCPVRLGDCVRLNYERAGITDVKGKVTSQSIKCIPGVSVTERATFTTKLWR